MSQLEKQVREFDILDKPLKEIAIAASHILDANFEYCRDILQIKRKGFASNYDYLKHIAKKKEFGLNRTDSRYAYTACLSVLRTNRSSSDKHKKNNRFEKRKIFEKSIKPFTPEQLNSISPYYEEKKALEREELAEKLRDLISHLPEKEADIILSRYYLNQTRTEIAKRLNTFPQRIEQIEQIALERLYFRAKEHNLQEYLV
ncbi:MAG: sigma factor-like helix-turn-helix DNA-binding protein [archaeon]|nr:sigma factor-like helix-turn-helix DNA-binding protein [archaeon]